MVSSKMCAAINSASSNDLWPIAQPPVACFPEEIENALIAMGEPRFRGEQIFSWLQKRGVTDVNEMTNLSKSLRERLKGVDFSWPLEIGEVHTSADGTRKIQMPLRRGGAVETVLIPEGKKLTQCISTQLGCAVGCIFCRSGHAGLKRNLTAAEIVGQVQLAKAAYSEGERLSNVVFMGIGEPLHNINATLRALRLISHNKGIDLSTRRVTISTVGFVKGLKRLSEETNGEVALAVSLHAADDETRRRLVPHVSDSLDDIVAALKAYPLPKRRRITIEYVMLKGINDTEAHARQLVKRLSPLRVKVNLLPLNPHDKSPFAPPDDETVARFQKILTDKGLSVFLRKRRGDDINAACGQLLAVE